MRFLTALASSLFFSSFTFASPYRPDLTSYNLNVNQSAQSATDYSTTRSNTTYTPSPQNWRSIPMYTVLMDKFADGDPSNNQFFNSPHEWDWRETQLRFGGDLKGLISKLDYIQGMGVKAIYLSGTIFLNMIWQADSYSPLDFSVLDPHWGTIDDWVNFIDILHARGIYVNSSAPFSLAEYPTVYKNPRYIPWGFEQYVDFSLINERNTSCELPVFWQDDGIIQPVTGNDGCYESDFDQYGDMDAFGMHPAWQRQLSKFASVQDRLREWKPSVLNKLTTFSCMTITALDIDAIRVDKSTQLTVDGLTAWASATRACASNLGKKNFYITGEVTGGDTFGSLYLGRGRTPAMPHPGFLQATNLTGSESQYFLRPQSSNGLDGYAFHYSIYRSLIRFLGVANSLVVTSDLDANFITAWNQMFVNDDFLNPNTGLADPKHLFGTSNFDVFRWPGLVNGTSRSALGSYITYLVMPGVPLIYYGEEQNFYLYDSTASNYLFGRQAMMSNKAWQRHGCYRVGSAQYPNMALEPALTGCDDDWNSLDHFDPTTDMRRLLKHFLYLRTTYNALQDGFDLIQHGNWTYFVDLPGSNHTATEMGLWSVSRAGIPNVQNLTGEHTDQVWLLYSNQNSSQTHSYDCSGPLWLSSPYVGGTTVRNLLSPYENYTLVDSGVSYYNNGMGPWYGCLQTVDMDMFGFKALVPVSEWVPAPPMLTKFLPGHDARLEVMQGMPNATIVNIALEFNVAMSCDSVTHSLSFSMSSSGTGGQPMLDLTSVVCNAVMNPTMSPIIIVNNPSSFDGTLSTGNTDHLLLRKGEANNVMVFPESDYDNADFNYVDGQYTFTHRAYGADMFRYSGDFTLSWSNWTSWENVTTIPADVLINSDTFWTGQHLVVQYWSGVATTASVVVHADLNHKQQRRIPQFLARGPFNNWGYDQGISNAMNLVSDGTWELEIMTAWPTYLQLNVFGYDDYFYGDVDGDGILDRLPPNTIALNYLNLSAPPYPALAWALIVDDATLAWTLEPRGQASVSAIMYTFLCSLPPITGVLAVVIFIYSFYGIRHNLYGVKTNWGASKCFSNIGSLGSKPTADFKECVTPIMEKIFGHKPNAEIIGWPEDKNKRRKVLIATLEYEIIDWKIKVKIGGLGVMSSLMGKAMTDVDLIWEYPAGEPAEPIEVTILNEPYLVDVETHVLDNITYVILDSPVFRAQTKSDPYPARMDDLSSAIFYSTWNQAIATTIRRFPVVDIYHINDYHGALAPIYLLPKVVPVCLSLHNAEFQGLWPLRTKEEMKEVCSVFNISKEHCTKYVQFGNTFNLLHAAASFISVHQKSIGVAGVSDKYGKRSWVRYPALWTLKHVDSLPNPDPTDIAALDENPVAIREVQIDRAAEAQRPEMKRQAQEWANIKQDPNSDLFVFVGRWSKQKGVDLIADVMPSLLEKRPSIQLICVGPVIDLYGRFAAEKLTRLMEMYPDRVYAKLEFTVLPPYLFGGADFALIPSRDEPFGLVAVEFGRKGALGVGSRLGGLGLMPGWWFPVESTSTDHMLSQLSKTIKLALKSTEEERAMLRARSAIQRFPVIEWRQRMEDIHRRSINASRNLADSNAWREADCGTEPSQHAAFEVEDWNPVNQGLPVSPGWDVQTPMSSPRFMLSSLSESEVSTPHEESFLLTSSPRFMLGSPSASEVSTPHEESFLLTPPGFTNSSRSSSSDVLEKGDGTIAQDRRHAPDPFLSPTSPSKPFGSHSLAISVVKEKTNSPLNKAIMTFTDSDGSVTSEFVQKLQTLNSNNSKGELSIEKYLVKSENAFFERARRDKLSDAASHISSHRERIRIMLARKIGSWPLYTIIIALGQMLAANSYQMTLLTGQNYQENVQLYVLSTVFLISSFVWYTLFRLKPSVYVLSAPWLFYGLAFFLIAIPSLSSKLQGTHTILSDIATWSYTVASAASFLFFGLNFGEEAAAATEVWILRACIVQGSQQIWVAALWYWGSTLNTATPGSVTPWWIVFILWPLSIMSFAFAYLMLYGLPEYYRQTPSKVPNLLKTLLRRKLVLWFLASEILRDYWLSGPYGRNWSFLWNVPIPKSAIMLLVIFFFVGVWALMLYVLTSLSKTHTWLLPVFAVGLGAPRWCQTLWGTSSLALYIPWAGSGGPYLGLSLWLWLGVLDAVQGVGLGMILLQTLSRLHVCSTLALAQVIGSICVMAARASAPNRIGPGSVFPNVGTWDFSHGLRGSPMASAPFWLALICQIVIVLGYFWFYRKEQLGKSSCKLTVEML
ncbi:glycoside hydrolase family 13/glycosyltransferase family 5 protein [Suillus bovinus]|uniref:glycoside hydrolase family 13/glycosyltransferase family 5 protein n=1 Tax=Suillus bovinus TaxID=48563 RepID=UPI001B85F108|nr:glycoside hydrolase family 13/glycosyltransferase family 5 protein [Suillus bovinus]KAG2151025.1 glycoside hydrolase family 13/glycosyltransferase family 5 protein [Suillus bovinus]